MVGMAALFPGAADLDAYWRNVTAGADCVTEAPAGYGLDQFPAARGGFVGELAEVDVIGMGVMPAALPNTEPDQLIALHVAGAAVADSRGGLGDPERVGVILGRGGYITAGLARIDLRVRVAHQLEVTLRELMPELDADTVDRVRERFLAQLGPQSAGSEIGLVPNLAASRVANRLGFGGPAYTVDAACASSLIAIDHAVAELSSGRCDAVLAGGIHHGHDATLWSVFSRLGAVSRSGTIRPFDRDADGLLIGEGTGVVVLKRLADAHRDGDRVYAVVRGTGVASDGGGVSLMHPATSGQVLAVRRAWAAAGLDPAAPDSVGLVEAHGTATPAGDAAEVATLREVFGAGEPAVIGSVKSMIGHAMPAAGIAGLIKAALAVYHGVLPPTLHCANPHPELAETRFRPLATARPWEGPRRAAVNAFGFGGISAHVVVEQDPSSVPPTVVLRLAADTPAELVSLLDKGVSGGTGPCRLSIVEPNPRKLATARRVVAAGAPWRGRNDIWFSPLPLLPAHPVAFVYPGLEADFAPSVEDIATRFGLAVPDLSADTLGGHGTALVAVSRLLDTALRRLGVEPDVLAGHSIGEWTAMIAADMYDDAELDRVLAAFDPRTFRVPDLVFATVGLAAAKLEPRLTGQITLSHDNSPNQSVVCGPADEVDALLAELLDERVLGQVLPFRSGFHTPRLAPFLDQIERESERMSLRPPALPIWSATTTEPYPTDPDAVRALFYRHLLEPVRFRPMIEKMYESGVRVFVQVGPGQLSTVIGDVLHGRDHLVVAASSARHSGLGQLARCVAALWTEGAQVDDTLLTTLPVRPTRTTRLELGGKIVSLGQDAATLIDRVRTETALPADLRTLLAETERASLDVLTAAHGPTRPTSFTREMSLRAMPHLRDHSFFEVPANWPDQHDGFPVVPATELLRQMSEAAEQFASAQSPSAQSPSATTQSAITPSAAPTLPRGDGPWPVYPAGVTNDLRLGSPVDNSGFVAIAVHDARFERWLAVEPPIEVTFHLAPEAANRVRVTVAGHASVVVELAPTYPSTQPEVWRPPADERAPLLTGQQMYDQRWMFHGPAYQGVTEITAIGPRHIRGVITTPAAPGSLLDNAGHFVGYWTLEEFERDSRTFPVRFGGIRFFGPHPRPGDRVDCHARIDTVTDTAVIGCLQLVRANGTLWAQADDWELRRFASDDRIRGVERHGGTALLGESRGEWVAVGEAWTDLASRELIARGYLTDDEWAEYEAAPPRGRRHWLLGRLALKDAVRAHLLRSGRKTVFPIELSVDDSTVTGRHGLDLPPMEVSVAHCEAVGVAIARPRASGVGIGLAVEDAERAAKDAVGKVDPGQARVTAATAERITVRTDTTEWHVHLEGLCHAGKDYIVAWTGKDTK
ncbi:modular polyketide synthase [Alloactinosynnema sp. L-07]|nr:modular polyketide synthase [Alloactinosynnema sp. L-07]